MVPTPYESSGYHLFVMAAEKETIVNVTCSNIDIDNNENQTKSLLSSDSVIDIELHSKECCLITTDKPVLAIQGILREINNNVVDPSLFCLIPIDQYSSNYTFKTPTEITISDLSREQH